MKNIKDILEASLLDIDGTLSEDGELLEFVQWFVNNQFDCCKQLGHQIAADKDEVVSGVLKTVKKESKGTFVIDVLDMFDNCPNRFWNDRFYIPQSGVPKFIKHLKFTGCKYGGPFICSLTHDLSKLEISSYTDKGNSFGDVEFTFWSGIKKKDVKIGKLTCKDFKISYNKQIESIMVANGSTILSVDLSSAESVKQIYGKFLDAQSLRLPRKLVNNVLADYGLVQYGADIQIYG